MRGRLFRGNCEVESISIVPMLAMGNAMSTFTAQNVGAGQLERVNKGYRMCYAAVLSAGAFSCVFSISCLEMCSSQRFWTPEMEVPLFRRDWIM